MIKLCGDNHHVAIVNDEKLRVFDLDNYERPTQRANISFASSTLKDIDWHENNESLISCSTDRSVYEYDNAIGADTHHSTDATHLLGTTCVRYLNHEVVVTA